jgi:hypothetical protein
MGKTGLSSFGTPLFLSQLGGRPLLRGKFFKKTPGVDYFIDEVKQILSESPKFCPSSHEFFVSLLTRGAKKIQGFKKDDCCVGDVRKVRYTDASIESISMRLAHLSIRDSMLLESSECTDSFEISTVLGRLVVIIFCWVRLVWSRASGLSIYRSRFVFVIISQSVNLLYTFLQ